jgi:hypothetical protein
MQTIDFGGYFLGIDGNILFGHAGIPLWNGWQQP